MRKSVIALTVLALGGLVGPSWAQVGPLTAPRCNNIAIQAASTASLATLIAGVAGKTIAICGWHVTSSAATASTFQFSQGTGTNCATTNTPWTPAFNVTSTAPSADHSEQASLTFASFPATATPINVCVISSTTSLQISVWYSQY